MLENNDYVKFAADAVRQACELVRAVQAEAVTPSLTKSDRSPVTLADFAAQAVIGRLLSEAYPDDVLVAEESSESLLHPEQAGLLGRVAEFAGRYLSGADPQSVCRWIDHGAAEPGRDFWTLDPVDGTKGFLRGGQYAVAMARIEDGQVRIGILGCPNLTQAHRPDPQGPGSLVVAVAGEGCFTSPLWCEGEYERLEVSGRRDPGEARLLRSFEASHTNTGQFDRLASALSAAEPAVAMDSQAKYAVLASGHGEVLVRLLSPQMPDYREKIWDQAAGALIVEQAGGRITDLDGRGLDFRSGRILTNNRGVVATNGYLHDAVLGALDKLKDADGKSEKGESE